MIKELEPAGTLALRHFSLCHAGPLPPSETHTHAHMRQHVRIERPVTPVAN